MTSKMSVLLRPVLIFSVNLPSKVAEGQFMEYQTHYWVIPFFPVNWDCGGLTLKITP